MRRCDGTQPTRHPNEERRRKNVARTCGIDFGYGLGGERLRFAVEEERPAVPAARHHQHRRLLCVFYRQVPIPTNILDAQDHSGSQR